MKTYYFLDPNGLLASEDGRTRYRALNGPKAYAFLTSDEGKNRRVVKISDEEDPNEVFLEVAESLIPFARQGERREQYVNDNREEAGYIELSLDAPVGEGDSEDELTLMEMVPNEDESVEDQCDGLLAVEALMEALTLLNEAEQALISALYLQNIPLTEREYAEKTGIPRQTVHYRKTTALKKLKEFSK